MHTLIFLKLNKITSCNIAYFEKLSSTGGEKLEKFLKLVSS